MKALSPPKSLQMLKPRTTPEPSKPVTPLSPEIELLARVMDNAIQVPGSRIRFGLDALLGLLPGVGDSVTALVSLYVLHAARKQGVPRVTLLRMAANVAIDVTVGAIPLLGDVFDVFWRSNEKNVALLRKHVQATSVEARKATASDWLFLGAIAIVLVALLVGSAVIAYSIIALIGRALG
jgi:hypothetical protein